MASKPPVPNPTTSSSSAEVTRAATAPPNSSHSSRQRPSRLLIRTYALPIAGLALGVLFYVYSRTSVQAAKVNAQRHRDADGGSISWRNEGLRRHGRLEKPQERTIWQQLLAGGRGDDDDEASRRRRELENKRLEADGRRRGGGANVIEEGIRRARDQNKKDADAGADEKQNRG